MDYKEWHKSRTLAMSASAKDAINVKQKRLGLTSEALTSLQRTTESLQTLVDSYPESEGPFGSSHPRTCYANMLATLREKAKALAKGRV